MEIRKINVNEIIEEIVNAGYMPGQLINYSEFQELNKKFGRGLYEIDFAQRILGITYFSYINLKNPKRKVRILKSQEIIITEEERQEIIKEIISAGYTPGQLINYTKLHELNKTFGRGLKDSDFAQEILDITYENYKACKNRGTNVRILKSQEKVINEEERQEIIEEIINSGYTPGQLINYTKLHELNKTFGRGLKEELFAQKILGIKSSNYRSCKNKGTKVRIFNLQQTIITEEKRQEIIKEIISAGYTPGQLINYNELNLLHEKFGKKLDEIDFAQRILDITYDSYNHCKNDGKKSKILKSQEIIITEEERQEIIEEIIDSGYTPGQLISYNELHELNIIYGRGLKEGIFAKKILGIQSSHYEDCKDRGARAKILKAQEKVINEEERQEIIKEIIDSGYTPGQLINYTKLHELNKTFGRGLKEVEFAQKILGLTYSNYLNCKNQEQKIRIRDGIKIEKAKEIMAIYTSIPKFYSKEDIEEICKEYNLTVDDFIRYVYLQNFYDHTPFIDALNNNNGLWIGKSRMSKEYVEKNIQKIDEIAINISICLCQKYRIMQKQEDYKQDIIVYIIENMGNLEKNIGNSEEIFNIIRGKVKKRTEGIIVESKRISNRFYTLTGSRKYYNKFEIDYADSSINIEDIIEEKIENEMQTSSEDRIEKCINLLKKYINQGINKKDAIERTSKDMDINSEIMLEYIQTYLLQKGKIKLKKEKNIPSSWEESR